MLQRLIREEEGQDLVEYAFLLAWIALIAVAGVRILGGNLNTMYQNIESQISGS